MTSGAQTIIYPVKDLAAARAAEAEQDLHKKKGAPPGLGSPAPGSPSGPPSGP